MFSTLFSAEVVGNSHRHLAAMNLSRYYHNISLVTFCGEENIVTSEYSILLNFQSNISLEKNFYFWLHLFDTASWRQSFKWNVNTQEIIHIKLKCFCLEENFFLGQEKRKYIDNDRFFMEK